MKTLLSTTALSHRLEIEYLPIESLILDPENARQHSPAQIRQIARSIDAFHFNVPVLVDGTGKVLAGHGRVLAQRLRGEKVIPVIRLEHLTPAQARGFSIADNRLSETSTWDEGTLARHLKDLSELNLDFDLEATGFTVGEIDLKIIGAEANTGDEPDPDDDLPPAGPAVARAGDLWHLDRHTILCGNALEAESYQRLMGTDQAAMAFTDPPYNVRIDGHATGKGKRRHREFAMASGEMTEPEFTAFLGKSLRLMADATADGALSYVCMDWRHAFTLQAAARAIYTDHINTCVWTKPGGGMGGLYRSAHEFILVFKNGTGAHRNNVQLGKYGRNRLNHWAYPGSAAMRASEDGDLLKQHPTPKPVRLIADAILDVTARRDLIVDPFLGSGSTLIAAERTGRICRGIEIDPLYVDLTIRRWQRLTGENARREDGATFDALADAGAAS
jgi:DNA modification methylase